MKNVFINPFFPNAPFLPLENIRKPQGLWCFYGVQKGCIGNKWVNKVMQKIVKKGKNRKEVSVSEILIERSEKKKFLKNVIW